MFFLGNGGGDYTSSLVQLSGLPLQKIATGGVRHGLDIARAVALGATAGGLARPFLKAWNRGGRDAWCRYLQQPAACRSPSHCAHCSGK